MVQVISKSKIIDKKYFRIVRKTIRENESDELYDQICFQKLYEHNDGKQIEVIPENGLE